MPGFLCTHCGHDNDEADLYCQNCGALRFSESARVPDAPSTDRDLGREETARTPSDVPKVVPAPDTEMESPEQDDPAAAQPELLDVLAGLIPEREVAHFGRVWAPAQPVSDPLEPAMVEEMKSRFGMSPLPDPARRPGKSPTEAIHRQFLLYGAILLAALLAFGLGSLSLPVAPYPWSGTEDAWQIIQNLDPGSQVLVYWQNDPAVAGELNLPLTPVLTHLLAVPADLHLFTQHPLGLAQARELLRTIQRRQAVTLSDMETSARIQEVGFWPGGYVVLPGLLPWLATHEPDLQIVVSADARDVIHWLEQVAPHTAAPVLAVTSAGVDPLIQPYRDSDQLAGVVRGYNGAQAYARLNAARFPNLQERETALHMATQNWVSTALILAFLAALLLRYYVTPPWIQLDTGES